MQQTQFMCLDWGRSLELKDCVREGEERKQQTLICDDLLNKLGVMEDATERQVCSLMNACCCSPAIFMMRQAVPGRQHSQNQHYKAQNQHSKAQNQHSKAQNQHNKALNLLSKAQNQHHKAQNQHHKAQNQLSKAQNQHRKAQNQLRKAQNQHRKAQNQLNKAQNQLRKAQNQHRKAQNQHRKAQNQHRKAQNQLNKVLNQHRKVLNQHRKAQAPQQPGGPSEYGCFHIAVINHIHVAVINHIHVTVNVINHITVINDKEEIDCSSDRYLLMHKLVPGQCKSLPGYVKKRARHTVLTVDSTWKRHVFSEQKQKQCCESDSRTEGVVKNL